MRSWCVADFAAITSVGHDAPRTFASLRAGLEGFVELPFQGESGDPLRAAPIRGTAEGVGGVDRYEALAVHALAPLIARLAPAERAIAQVVVGLPRPSRPGAPSGLADALVARLARTFGLSDGQILPVEAGSPSVFLGLHDLASVRDATVVIAGGVDVLTDPRSLRALSRAALLKESWDGFVPGEAAAFVRLTPGPSAGYWGGGASRLLGIGVADEPAAGTADDPLVGVGMARALRAAVEAAGVREADIVARFNDLSGARTAFEDDALSVVRYYRSPRPEVLPVLHLGSTLGEVGAAAGALLLMWAGSLAELGLAPPGCAMLTTSDGPVRAAAILAAGAPRAPRVAVSRGAIALQPAPVREEVGTREQGMGIREVDRAHRDLCVLGMAELSALALIRSGHLADPTAEWSEIEEFEDRLLATLDALAWNRDEAYPLALAALEGTEPEEVAAATMVLGTGPDTESGWFALLAQLHSGEASLLHAVTGHAALCPAAWIGPRLASVLDDPPPEVARAVAWALVRRGEADRVPAERWAAERRDALLPVALEVAAAAGKTDLAWLVRWCEVAPDAFGHADLLWFVARGELDRRLLDSACADAAPFVAAMAALRFDRPLFPALAHRDDLAPSQIEALGWAAECEAVPLLIDRLAHEGSAASAAVALDLILGGDRFVEGEEDGVSVRRLATDPELWRAAHRSVGAPRSGRWRHGQPWRPGTALLHLARSAPAPVERLLACWEHAATSGAGFPVDPWQLVAAQRARLAVP